MPITITPDSATVGTTERFLASDSTTATYQTADCILQALIDFAALQAGDEYRVRIYEKIDGTTVRVIYEATVIGVQSQQFAAPAFVLGSGWEVSVAKIAGTDRTIAWSLNKVTAA